MKAPSDRHPDQDLIDLCGRVHDDPNFIPQNETPEDRAEIEADAAAQMKERQEAGVELPTKEILLQIARLRLIDKKRAESVEARKIAYIEKAIATIRSRRRLALLITLLGLTTVESTLLLKEAGSDELIGNAEKCDFFREPIRDPDYSIGLREDFSTRAAKACDSLIFDDFIKALHQQHERILDAKTPRDLF